MVKKPLNRFLTTSSFEKLLDKKTSGGFFKYKSKLEKFNNDIIKLKKKKNELIDTIVNLYKSQCSKKKEFDNTMKLQSLESLLETKIHEKQTLLLHILKTI